MTTVLACVNLKGGVGKTAIAVNFAAYCGRQGFKTLLVDVDPQTNATFSCIEPEAWSKHAKKNGTVATLLGVRGVTAEGKSVDVKKVAFINSMANSVAPPKFFPPQSTIVPQQQPQREN